MHDTLSNNYERSSKFAKKVIVDLITCIVTWRQNWLSASCVHLTLTLYQFFHSTEVVLDSHNVLVSYCMDLHLRTYKKNRNRVILSQKML